MEYNLAVITTKYILEEGEPILYVIRDEDGDWQFLDGQDITEADAIVVSLGQIIERDNSIKELLDMPKETEAKRKDTNNPWVFYKL